MRNPPKSTQKKAKNQVQECIQLWDSANYVPSGNIPE